MKQAPETIAVHAGRTGGADVTAPIRPSTTYLRDTDYALIEAGVGYSRDANPTFIGAETVLARLESGHDCMLFSSGSAAASAVTAQLKPGQRILLPRVMYWGLRQGMQRSAAQGGFTVDFYLSSDLRDLESRLAGAPTSMVWIETPSNPTWDVIDIQSAAGLSRKYGARSVIDSTVATPVHTRPLELGADIVMHSATKYLNGHSDAVVGALVTARADEFWQQLKNFRADNGAVPGVLESWLLQRGLKTLFLRVRQSSQSALTIARYFENHEGVERILYPGLASHPGHNIAARQMGGGYGGMLSILVRGSGREALSVASRCRLFSRATSLGSVESLIEHRATIEGPDSPIPENLLRLSIGIEAVEDLITDLKQALG